MNFDINEFANWFTERYGAKLSIADARFVEMVFGKKKHITKTRHSHKALLLTAALEYYKEKRDGPREV